MRGGTGRGGRGSCGVSLRILRSRLGHAGQFLDLLEQPLDDLTGLEPQLRELLVLVQPLAVLVDEGGGDRLLPERLERLDAEFDGLPLRPDGRGLDERTLLRREFPEVKARKSTRLNTS